MLSFSGSAKAEVCKEYPQSGCCALAECFGILLFCNSFSEDCIKIITESQDFARLLPKLFRKAFGLSFDSCPEEGSTGKQVFAIRSKEKITKIMESFGFSPEDTLSLHINLPVVEAAQEQLAAIRVLREKEMVEALPGKLQAALKAREENPEATLTELAAMMEPPITKPAMNHRLKRIVEIAGEVRE